jgi:HEAT repeat protein
MALAAIGTNAAPAVPTIVRTLASAPSPYMVQFLSPLQHLPLREGDLDPALEQWSRNASSSGFSELMFIEILKIRTPAAARVLTNSLHGKGISAPHISSQLTRFSAHADIIVPALTAMILDGDKGSRSEAVRLLDDFRARSDLAIPALLRGVRTGNLDCIRALRSLSVDSADLNRLLNELVDCHQDRLAVTLATELKMQTPLAVRVLTNSLLSDSQSEREIAAAGVYRLGSQAERILPALIGMLDHPDLAVRSQAIHILQQFGSRAAPALPALVRALKDEDENFRYDVIYALQSMGTNALPALPELQEATHDESSLVRAGARRALNALGQTRSASSLELEPTP